MDEHPPLSLVALLELHVRLGEEAALEFFRVHRPEQLLERDDDAQSSLAPLAPVRAAHDVPALRIVIVLAVGIEEIDAADPCPPGDAFAHLTEERHPLA